MGLIFMRGKGFEPSNATVRWTVAGRRLDDGDTIIFAKGENVTNPIIHPRKDTRLDTFFKSGISFLCWNDAQNWVLFQLFCYIVFCGGTERCRNGN
jgi:hypothetical protein